MYDVLFLIDYITLTHLTTIGRVHEIETTFIIEYNNYIILDID